jgi:hypothetical protein
LVWEVVQLPLYTIWWTGTAAEVAFAVLHCTAGDLVIMTSSLVAALVVFGQGWPFSATSFRNVMLATIVIGVAYTIYGEWLNVSVRGTWAYTKAMPLVPPLGTGLLPLLQWIAVPGLAFVIVRRRVLADAALSKSPGPPLA